MHRLIPDLTVIQQHLNQLTAIANQFESVEAAEDFCENCRLDGSCKTTNVDAYREAMRFLMGAEALNLAIAYWQQLIDQSAEPTEEDDPLPQWTDYYPNESDYFLAEHPEVFGYRDL